MEIHWCMWPPSQVIPTLTMLSSISDVLMVGQWYDLYIHFEGHPNTALALLKRGVPLMMPNKNGAISLHTAARYGHASVVKALLNKGAAVDSKTKVWISILMYDSQQYPDSMLVAHYTNDVVGSVYSVAYCCGGLSATGHSNPPWLWSWSWYQRWRGESVCI